MSQFWFIVFNLSDFICGILPQIRKNKGEINACLKVTSEYKFLYGAVIKALIGVFIKTIKVHF